MDLLGAIAREPSAQLMLLGYLLYAGYVVRALLLRLASRGDAELPEPCVLAWILFAIGTALHVGVELLYGVPIRGLYADMVCGTMSVGIALLALVIQRLATSVPIDVSQPAPPENLRLKCCYAQCALIYLVPEFVIRGVAPGFLPEMAFFALGTASLLALNVMGVLEFVPLLKETRQGKTREWALPWLVWTLAYAAMWQVRFEDLPAAASWSEGWMLSVYTWLVILHPALSIVLHVLMALVAVVGARSAVDSLRRLGADQSRRA